MRIKETERGRRQRIETKNENHLWSVLREHAYELVWVWLAALVQEA